MAAPRSSASLLQELQALQARGVPFSDWRVFSREAVDRRRKEYERDIATLQGEYDAALRHEAAPIPPTPTLEEFNAFPHWQKLLWTCLKCGVPVIPASPCVLSATPYNREHMTS